MVLGVSIGILLLSLYLILVGLSAFIPSMSGLGKVIPVLALLAGVCLLLGR